MMKVNDFLKYEISLNISYEDYFRLIYDNKYLIEARLGPDRTFIAKKSIYGNSRKKAVQKAVQWFWKDFKGVLGPAHKVMTVDDPHEEVSYDEDFACNDLGHKYLDESTLERLLAEADGELVRDDSVGSENHPPNSVKRIKRRRKQNVQLTSRLTQSPGGTIYYRMTEMPDSDRGPAQVQDGQTRLEKSRQGFEGSCPPGTRQIREKEKKKKFPGARLSKPPNFFSFLDELPPYRSIIRASSAYDDLSAEDFCLYSYACAIPERCRGYSPRNQPDDLREIQRF